MRADGDAGGHLDGREQRIQTAEVLAGDRQSEPALAGTKLLAEALGVVEDVRLTENIRGQVWSKLLVNSSCTGLSAVSGLRYGAVAVNTWAGWMFPLASPPWGAYPGSAPQDIRNNPPEPNTIRAPLLRASASCASIICRIQIGSPHTIAAYRRALRLYPGFAEAWNDLGTARYAKGEFEAAVDCYQRALRLRPDHVRWPNPGRAPVRSERHHGGRGHRAPVRRSQ